MEKTAKVLVFGSTGFIGQHLMRHIAENRSDSSVACFNKSGGNDIRDYASVFSFVKKADLVINLAGSPVNDRGWSRIKKTLETDGLGAAHILHASRATNTPLIHVSSAEVYGTNVHPGRPMPEEHPLHPKNPYGVAKKTAEETAFALMRAGAPIRVLRLFNPYGTGDTKSADFIPRLVRQAITEGNLPLSNNGIRRRDWIFAKDAAEAIWASRNARPGVYNIARGVFYSDMEVARLVQREVRSAIRTKSRVVSLPCQTPVNEPLEQYGDPSRFFEETGWHARTSLEEGIRHSINFYLEQYA
ncbi:MAG: NAD(P)-dependent oxidoreductase [Candidatus Sungbacteria bacterium]|nr:NAD(P)-dependent oxidoreductase [Candidatus Sungbacteria bacterium]